LKLDLVVLVADSMMRSMVEQLLRKRTSSLGIRKIAFDVLTHPNKDPGVYKDSCSFLRGYLSSAEHAVVILDCAWEGNYKDRIAVEDKIEADFENTFTEGWGRAIAIEPELENWIFATEAHLKDAIGWTDEDSTPKSWLISEGLWTLNEPKPSDPKAALERLCKRQRIILTGSIHAHIASHSGFRDCIDPAFLKLRELLTEWFPA
jgi:hypothetical protein